MYLNGTLKTWCQEKDFVSDVIRYRGREPRFKKAIQIVNRFLLSSYAYPHWALILKMFTNGNIEVKERNKILSVEVTEIWPNISNKTFAALKFALEKNVFDYVLKANSTCYVNLSVLDDYLNSVKEEVVYAGPVLQNKKFVSGWAIFLSPKAVKLLVSARNRAISGLFDDELIGKIFKEHEIEPTPIPFVEIDSLGDIDNLSEFDIRTTPLYRVKGYVNQSRIDDKLMQRLHSRIVRQYENE